MRRLLPLALLAVLLLAGCPPSSLGLVRVTTADGNKITGVVTSNGNDTGQMTITGQDGSEYRLKFQNIKIIERLGDAPPPPPPPGGPLPANAPAEAPPPPPSS